MARHGKVPKCADNELVQRGLEQVNMDRWRQEKEPTLNKSARASFEKYPIQVGKQGKAESDVSTICLQISAAICKHSLTMSCMVLVFAVNQMILPNDEIKIRCY